LSGEVAAKIAFVKLIQDPKHAHNNPDDEYNGSDMILHLISLVKKR